MPNGDYMEDPCEAYRKIIEEDTKIIEEANKIIKTLEAELSEYKKQVRYLETENESLSQDLLLALAKNEKLLKEKG